MDFKELFEKYKNDDVTLEEKKFVEDELEKYQLINDYYAEKELDFEQDFMQQAHQDVEVKSIRRAMRKRNLMLIGGSTGALLLILLMSQFVFKPVLNNLFYNPNTYTYSKTYNDLSISMTTFDTLHSPGLDHHVWINNTGIGKYDLSIQVYENGNASSIMAKLNKGKIEMNDYFNTFPSVSPFGQTKNSDFNIGKDGLALLDKSLRIEAYLTFDHSMTLEQLIEMFNSYSGFQMTIDWASVDQSRLNETVVSLPVIGFDPSGGYGWGRFENINEFYPDYDFFQQIDQKAPTGELYISHFKSLINYQLDHLDYLKAFDPTFDYKTYYEEMLKTIDEHGIQINGLVVSGFVEPISQFVEHYNVDDVMINEVKVLDVLYK